MLANDFFSVISKEIIEGGIETRIKFNAGHFIYQAHFPENPITPGVCILQIAKELIEEHVAKKLFMTEAKNIKYLQVLDPINRPEVFFKMKITEDEGFVHAGITVESDDICFTKITATYKNA